MSTTFKPKAQVSVQKVRVGHQGYSVMLKVMKAQVSTNKNFTAELEDIKARSNAYYQLLNEKRERNREGQGKRKERQQPSVRVALWSSLGFF